MSFPEILGTGDVQRKMLACAIDISETSTPNYLVIGYKITSSAVEFNPETEMGTDINGRNFGSVNKFEPSQTFEPHRLTAGQLGRLGEKLLHYFRYRQYEKFSQFKCILIYGFLASSEEGPFPADKYDSCTIVPNSVGGETWTEMPFSVTFGGNVTHGYVDKLIDTVTFTDQIVAATGVAVSPKTLSLEIGVKDTEQLVVAVSPSNATNKKVTYSSDDIGVAEVSSSGLVEAIGNGECDITVKTDDGNFTDTCTVTVTGGEE